MAFVQRFESGLRLDLHFHVLWTDGVFAHEVGRGLVEFCEHEVLSDADGASNRIVVATEAPQCVNPQTDVTWLLVVKPSALAAGSRIMICCASGRPTSCGRRGSCKAQ